TWTILVVPDIPDFGVMVAADRAEELRRVISAFPVEVRHQQALPQLGRFIAPALESATVTALDPVVSSGPAASSIVDAPLTILPALAITEASPAESESITESLAYLTTAPVPVIADHPSTASTLTGIEAHDISAWFATHQVLDRVSLSMPAGEVTALIGPSGCGKSTFLRILNRMHEMIPAAAMAGEVLLDGHDIYDPSRKLTDARREIGMVFQKPNPFPAMSIYDNVLASLRLTGVKASTEAKDEIVESCLTKAGLWKEVQDRLRKPGGGLSGGQQQRLCIARALAIRPRVLLMDEPCSALDPTSTRRIEETIIELVSEVTIVIVTHNMQQAARVSSRCAFFLAEHGTPGYIVEHGATEAMFNAPQDQRTNDYVNGRFG
ncbi:MAG: phosphate ABC transporter ATP-binding protein, partial [Ilumatobacteraceae bacterium]